jgi:hypothetical protein
LPNIWNVNSTYEINTNKISKKLSFKVGENFSARVVNIDKATGEIVLKLLDGWQFTAKLEKPLENLKEALIKFEVQGFEDGKLSLKIINTDSKKEHTESDSIGSFLSEKNIDISKEDYDLLNKMIKHDIPLTKENISKLKTLVDFTNKIKNSDKNEDSFILKYMQSKNLDQNTSKGNKVKNTLKSFFEELKNLNEDDLLTISENNIDLTEENIKGFNNIFKKSLTIYNDIKSLGNEINKENEVVIDTSRGNHDTISQKNIDSKPNNLSSDKKNLMLELNKDSVSVNENNDAKIEEKQSILSTNSDETKLTSNEGSNKIFQEAFKKNTNGKSNDLSSDKKALMSESNKGSVSINRNILIKNSDKEKATNNEEIKLTSNEESDKVFQEAFKNNKNNSIINYNVGDVSKSLKDQISTKTEELKNIIKTVLEEKDGKTPEAYNNMIQALDKNIKDFHVFNMVSDKYYYLDLPINLNENQYECKLMIKDDRKKGKKIDGTNVKIAASVNTINMSTVDAYIKLNNRNINIDIKCNREWINVLDMSKEKVLSEISNMGYSVSVKVDEREKEMNVINCREFFQDNNTGILDTKV